jgi:hypothetical protein
MRISKRTKGVAKAGSVGDEIRSTTIQTIGMGFKFAFAYSEAAKSGAQNAIHLVA